MQLSSYLALLATAAGLAQADFVADFYSDYDSCNNGDDPGKSTTFTTNCLKVNNDYDTLKLSRDDGYALEQCGPYFTDSECTNEVNGNGVSSTSWNCADCTGYSPNVYVYVA